VSGYEFVSDEEVLERMQEFYDSILPVDSREEEGTVENEPERFQPEFDYSEEAVNGLVVVRTLLSDAFLNLTALIKATGLSKEKVKDAAKWLVKNRFVRSHQIPIGGRPSNYFEILPEALELLGGKAPAGRGGFQHKFYCHRVKDYFLSQGMNVYFEAHMQGMRGAFDLRAGKDGHKWFGVEVTLSFKNLVDNVVDGLKSSVDQIIVVTEKRASKKKAEEIVQKNLGEQDRVDFKTISEFKIMKGDLE